MGSLFHGQFVFRAIGRNWVLDPPLGSEDGVKLGFMGGRGLGSYMCGIMLDFIGPVTVKVHLIIRAEVKVNELLEDGRATEGVSGDCVVHVLLYKLFGG